MQQQRRVMWNATVKTKPFHDQLRAAQIAGCSALSVTPSDYNRWLGSGVSTHDLKRMAADYGIEISHLDPFVRWVDDWKPSAPGVDFPTNSVAFDADDFFRMADALGTGTFTAWGGFPDGRYSTQQVVDSFGALCDRAARHGMQCGLEFIPLWEVGTLKKAWEVVSLAGARNGGIVLDMWHYFRGTPDDALLASIPGSKIFAVQLCDAPKQLPRGMTLAQEGLGGRLLPGSGDFPIGPVIDVLREKNGLNNVGLEIFSDEIDAMDTQTVGRIAKDLMHRFGV